MNKHDCYVVDGCVDFIPVKRSTLTSSGVEVTIVGSAQKETVLVDKVYQMPKLFEPQKVVVPNLIGKWLEACKTSRLGGQLSVVLQGPGESFNDSEAINIWLEYPENQDTIARAWLDGYEVEQEKLYTVEIPNPNGSGYSKTYLARNKDGKVELFIWSGYTSIEFADDWKQEDNAQLTESEIKQDFEWAWDAGFAKEVEEN